MKQFTILKVGYTKGIYGCSGEYFTCIYNNSKGLNSFNFYGMYGAEERISRAMKDKGYEEKYTPTDYGQMKQREVLKLFKSEYQMLEELKAIK